MSIASQLVNIVFLAFPVFIFFRNGVDEGVSQKKNIAGVSETNGVIGETSIPCMAKGRETLDILELIRTFQGR